METPDNSKLRSQIFLACFLFFLFHSLAFALIGLALGFAPATHLAFLATNAAFHLALAGVLLAMRFAFVKMDDGSPFPRLNIPTKLTLFRLTSTPVLLAFFVTLRDFDTLAPIIVYAVAAFVTDFLDGRISRRSGEVTKVGAYLDSMSDYAILLAISIAYLVFDLISGAFFAIIMARLLLQWLAMAILSLAERHFAEHRTSLLGKASVFVLMTSYVLVLIKLLPFDWLIVTGGWYFWMEVVVSVVMVVSLIEKMILLAVDLRAARANRQSS